MADIVHDILLFQGPDDQDQSLPQLLEQLGLKAQFESKAEALPAALESLNHPILVAYCGSSEENALALAKKLIQMPEVHCYPLIGLGYRVHELSSVLSSYFPISITVPLPYNSSHLFRAVSHVKNAYRRLVQVSEAHDRKNERRDSAPDDRSEDLKRDQARADVTLNLAEELDSLPEALFTQLKRLKLEQQKLEGRLYPTDISMEFIEERGYLPKEEKLCGEIKTYCAGAQRWVSEHLVRTSFIANKMADSTGVAAPALDRLRAAVFLYASAFSADDAALFRINYDEEKYASARKDLCSKIKDSAYRIAVDVRSPEVGDLVSRFAQMLGRERQQTGEQHDLEASILLAGDLIDRVCYQTGYWNPRAAYQLMRKFKSGYMREVHPLVWGCAVKFLSEAISSRTAICVLPKEMRVNQALIEEAMRVRNQEKPNDNEIQVPIADLTPGMKLSRPLISFDGKKILSDQVILDQDLVWRIWQLSAVRPLNPPIVVRDSASEDATAEDPH